MIHFAGKWYWQNKNKDEIRFWELWGWWCYSRCFSIQVVEKIQKKKQHHLSPLLTNKWAALSAQTDQSQFTFPAGFWHEIKHAGFWHQKNLAPKSMTDWPVNWYQKQMPETGQCVITISTWWWPAEKIESSSSRGSINISSCYSSSTMYVKSFQYHWAQRVTPISVTLAFSQTPVYTAKLQNHGHRASASHSVPVYSPPSFCWFLLEWWPGWVDLL